MNETRSRLSKVSVDHNENNEYTIVGSRHSVLGLRNNVVANDEPTTFLLCVSAVMYITYYIAAVSRSVFVSSLSSFTSDSKIKKVGVHKCVGQCTNYHHHENNSLWGPYNLLFCSGERSGVERIDLMGGIGFFLLPS